MMYNSFKKAVMCYTVPVKNIYQKSEKKITKKKMSPALYTVHMLHLQLGEEKI